MEALDCWGDQGGTGKKGFTLDIVIDLDSSVARKLLVKVIVG